MFAVLRCKGGAKRKEHGAEGIEKDSWQEATGSQQKATKN